MSEQLTMPGAAAAAVQLETWATAWNRSDDAVVDRTLRVLRSGSDLSAISSVDYLQHLPTTPGFGLTRGGSSRFLLSMRNVIVFLPIALTWFSLWNVSRSFDEYRVSLPSDEEINFFDYWRSGGDGSVADWERFGSVAIAVVGLIVAVIALSLASGVIGARQARRQRIDMAIFDAARRSVAVQVMAAVEPHRRVDFHNVDQSLHRALDDFKAAAVSLRESGQQMMDALVGADALGPQLLRVSERLGEVTNRVEGGVSDAIRGLNEEVGILRRTVGEMSGQLGRDFELQFSEMVNALELTAERLTALVRTTESGIERIMSDVENFGAIARG
jgi:hypothetical protein